ncbi:MAG: hypothetical protein U0794_15170 [Isosphaeraceae bacterium]
MPRRAVLPILVPGLLLVVVFAAASRARDDEPAASAVSSEVPPAFAPFEYLIGSWKGAARPTANPTRGWPETHAWAWAFDKGVPTGLAVTLQGNRQLASARLTFDAKASQYTLEGRTGDGKPVRFTGALDATRKQLVLDRVGTGGSEAKQRLTLYPNSNRIRYSLLVKEQEPGAPQYKNTVEIGLTKEGEALAGTSSADLPKCIITGGAATMRVSFQGQSFPVCCSGCVDEFNANPEKYIKKASLRRVETAKTPEKPRSSINKDDDAFNGLADDAPAKPATITRPSPSGAMKKPATAEPPTPKTKPALAPAEAERRASSALKLGENLEKRGNTTAALGYYRQVVTDYPNTAAARTAAQKIQALKVKPR